jgi:hypothetical protein
MTSDVQNIVALGLVLLAAAYVVRRVWQLFARKRAGGCGSCGTCPTSTEGDAAGVKKPFVGIDTLRQPPGRG